MNVLEWLKLPEVKKLRDEGFTNKTMGIDFFRDPLRSITYNPSVFYSAADGVVIYAKSRVKPDDFLNIKGRPFTVRELLCDDEYKYDSLVIGVFMTALDVHVNRMPASSFFVEERNTPNLFTNNSSMIDMEKGLLKNEVVEDNMKYLFSNERKVSALYSQVLGQRYYIAQIADKDVDVIINWGKGKWVEQGSRFGQIRWGSQCDVIIPLIKKHKYKIMVEPCDHVEAGIDVLFEVK